MDVFNRPPSISEDTLQYALYPPQQLFDTKISVTSLATCIREYADELLQNFIWHRDAFELWVVEDSDAKIWFLEGRMRVGDSVDDEWCTVWLLREISSKWDLVISVCDTDGEFLLIEAAEDLPPWVKPSNAENRVWIQNSRLHLIPLSYTSPPSRKRHRRKNADNADTGEEDQLKEDEDEYLVLEDAVKLVRDGITNTFAPAKVEAAVWRRISGYPSALREHGHTMRGYVPLDIAKALLVNPSLVQKAVETFYTRDAIQLRAAHRMSRFAPNTSVLRSIRMTRTAYAQLIGQKFFPPKIFGQWKENEGSKEYKWRDLGMKIAVGFEILYQECKGKSSLNEEAAGKSRVEANKDALRRNAEYTQYIQNLISTGYFKGEKEGSQLWNELETKAVNAFIESRSSSNERLSFAKQVELAVSQAVSISDPGLQDEDDDESWLTVDVRDFEAKLENTLGQGKKTESTGEAMDVDPPEISEEDRMATEQASRLKNLARKVEEFVEGEGDVEGAIFEDEAFSDEPLSDESSMDENQDSQEEEPGQNRSMAMDYASGSVATKEAMDKLVPGIDPDEYGKMPAAYYTNSQKVASTTILTDVVEDNHHSHDHNHNTLNPEPNSPSKISPPRVENESFLGTRRTKASSGKSGKPIREPILSRDKYDGVDSDDESDEDDIDEEEDEDMPQIVGDVEIDMGEEEEEFLEFSRVTLGISDEEWNEILRDREDRGAFVPKSAKATTAVNGQDSTMPGGASVKREPPRAPQPGPRPNVNPQLDSFETVMNAMDAELLRLRAKANTSNTNTKQATARSESDKGKGKAKEEVTDEEDIEAAMEAELKANLAREDGSDGEYSGEEGEGEGGTMEYNMIRNFLESFKSQVGLSGPVSNLAGRLEPGFRFPRDD